MAVTSTDANLTGYALQLDGRRSSRFASTLPYRLKHPVGVFRPIITCPRPLSESDSAGAANLWARLPGGTGVSFSLPLCATHGAWPFKWEVLTDLSSSYYTIDNDPGTGTAGGDNPGYGFITFTNVPAGTYSFVILLTDQFLQTCWVELTSVQFIDATTDNGANFVVMQPDGSNVSGVAGSWNNPYTTWEGMYKFYPSATHTGDSTYANHIVLFKGTGELSPVAQVKISNAEKPRHYIFLNGSSVTINASTYLWLVDTQRNDFSVIGPGTFDCHSTCEVTQQVGNFTADAGTDICTFTTGVTNITTGSSYTLSNSGGALPGGLSASVFYAIRVTDTTFRLAATYDDSLTNTYVDITSAGTGTHTARDFSISTNATARAAVFSMQKFINRATLAGFTIQGYTGTNSTDNPGPITGIKDVDVSYHYNVYAITFDAITSETNNGSLVKFMSACREGVIDGVFCSNVTSFQNVISLKHNNTDITVRRLIAYNNCGFATSSSSGMISLGGASRRTEICFNKMASANSKSVDFLGSDNYAVIDFAYYRNTTAATTNTVQNHGGTSVVEVYPPPRYLVTRNIFETVAGDISVPTLAVPFKGATRPVFDNKQGSTLLVDANLDPLIDYDAKYGATREYYA